MANRHQRRRWATKFRQAKIESVPRGKVQIDVNEETRKVIYRPEGAKGVLCDWAGCPEEWQFATYASVGKVRKVVARRCGAHRLTNAQDVS